MSYLSTITAKAQECVHQINESKVVKQAKTNLMPVVNKIERFIEAHEAQLLFGATAAISFYLTPGLFLVGVGVGIAASKLLEEKTDLTARLVTPFKTAFSTVGAIGSVLTYNYQGYIMKSFPVIGGAVVGNVLYNAYRNFYPLNAETSVV